MKKRSDIRSHEEWLASFKNDKVKILGRYAGRNYPIEVQCANPECGYIWSPRAFQVQKGQGCRICQYREKSENYKMKLETFDRRLKEAHGGMILRISPDEEYHGVNEMVEFLCLQCGHTWITTGSSVINVHTGCSKCCLSKYEKKVEVYLTESGISFEREKNVGNCRSVNGGLSFFDFVLTGERVRVIEVDGGQHFRNVLGWRFQDTVVSDILKNEYCEREGIPLLRIRYDQIRESELYKEMIDDFLADPEVYVHRHNSFLSNDEYYEERDLTLATKRICIEGMEWAVEAALKRARAKGLKKVLEKKQQSGYVDANGISYQTKREMCRANHISMRKYDERVKAGMDIKDVFSHEWVYDHEGNRFASEAEMCRYWNVPQTTFHGRRKQGWSLQDALTVVSQKKKWQDEMGRSLAQRARSAGMKPATFRDRTVLRGMSEQEALGTPLRSWEIEDGMGNVFKNTQEMCAAYGISDGRYRKRMAGGMDKVTALTTPIDMRKSHKREA